MEKIDYCSVLDKGGSKKAVGMLVAVMLMTGVSYADPIQVGCQFYDQEANFVGDGEYTYNPSVSDTFSYVTKSYEEKTFETNYATEFHPNITLYAGSGWTGGDYQLTHSIIDIWGGDDPGTLYAAGGGSPFSSILSGWQMVEPKRCSGCSVVSLSMDWDSLSGGSWSGAQRHQNSIDPTTGEIENHSAKGNFTCENTVNFEVHPDAMGIEGAVSTFVAYSGYDGPDLQYTWTQTEGPLATTIVEENTQVLRVTVPDLDADTVLKFTVSTGDVTKEITLPVLNRVDPIAGGGSTTMHCDLTTEAGVPGGTAQFSFDSSVVDVIVKGNMNRPIVIPMVDELFSTPGKLTDWVMKPILIAPDGSTFSPKIRLETEIIQWYHAGNPQPGQIVKYGSNNVDLRYDNQWMPFHSRYDQVTRDYLMSFDSSSLSWSEASGAYSVYDSTAGSVDGTFNCLSNPGTDNPGTDNPGTDSPGTDSPGADSPGADSPGADSPGADSPGTDSPGTDSPGTEDPEVVLSDQGSSGSGGGAFCYLLILLLGSMKVMQRSRNLDLME